MILYFSGTGNSEYTAKRIAEYIDDDCINLFDKLKSKDYSEIKSDKPFVIVTPTYAWQIPHILRDWINSTVFSGNSQIYFVLTCGGEIGNALKYARKLSEDKGFDYMGCVEILMPENYIAMFDAPETQQALEIVDTAESDIKATALRIKNGEMLNVKGVHLIDRVKSSIVNLIFYPVFVHAKKFVVSDKCIGCARCVTDCVMSNISLVDGKPVWQDNCTHCMACICRCPVGAIEYGNISKGKPRYTCPKE